MKKRYFYLTTILTLFPVVTNAGEDATTLQNGLNLYGGGYEKVTVSEGTDGFTVNFPEITYTRTEQGDDQEMKTISETMPGYVAKAVKEGTFYDKDVFKITADSNDALRYSIYQMIPEEPQEVRGFIAPELKNIVADRYVVENYFVPDLKLFNAKNLKINRVVYATIDEENGLKQEIGVVNSIDFKTTLIPNDGTIEHKTESNMQGLGVRIPSLLNFSIREANNNYSAVYGIDENTDISDLFSGLSQMKKSEHVSEINSLSQLKKIDTILKLKSLPKLIRADNTGKIRNLSLEIAILGINFNADIDSNMHSEIDTNTQTIRIDGDYEVSNLKIDSMFYSLPSGNVKTKYSITGIAVQDLVEIAVMSDNDTFKRIKEAGKSYQLTPEDEQFIRDFISKIDIAVKDVKTNFDADAVIDQSEIVAVGAAERSGNYFVGNADVTLYNYDKLRPDNSKQCEEDQKNNPSSVSWACMQADKPGAFDEYIDKSKRTIDAQGRTVDVIKVVFDATGVYVNGTKTADPIEIDFNKECNDYIQKLKNNSTTSTTSNSNGWEVCDEDGNCQKLDQETVEFKNKNGDEYRIEVKDIDSSDNITEGNTPISEDVETSSEEVTSSSDVFENTSPQEITSTTEITDEAI